MEAVTITDFIRKFKRETLIKDESYFLSLCFYNCLHVIFEYDLHMHNGISFIDE